MTNYTELIHVAQPRHDVQATFPDGRTFAGPMGMPLAEFIKTAYPDVEIPIVAALVRDRLRELSYPVHEDCTITPIDASTGDGMRIYHRSLTFVLVTAMREIYPEARVLVDYSVTLGGFYCTVAGLDNLDAEKLARVEQRMHEIVEVDEPILRQTMSLEEAIAHFSEQGYEDKVRLLRHASREDVTVYSLRGVKDYFYGYMLPSTGKLRCFALELCLPGFILRLPRRSDPNRLTPSRDYPKLTRVFNEYGRWLWLMGIGDVGMLNEAVENGAIHQVALVSEALHEKNISDIADDIVKKAQRINLVLIAGPSSSGKTTFARRLAIQLMVNGLKPFAIGLDDYFVDRDKTPVDENGEVDFEALEAINLDLFNQQLFDLKAGKSVRLAHFDFKAGKSGFGEKVSLTDDAVMIVEGIHGMNPCLVNSLPEESVYRVYVSALTQLNIDHHNRVPTTDTRLLRRIVRDAQYRGYSAEETIRRWESVRRGEEKNIFPYQENADVMFNSALAYELAVLKPYAEPLLLAVPAGTLEYIEARRLLSFLRWVKPWTAELVPSNSILREFIGGSILRDFRF